VLLSTVFWPPNVYSGSTSATPTLIGH